MNKHSIDALEIRTRNVLEAIAAMPSVCCVASRL